MTTTRGEQQAAADAATRLSTQPTPPESAPRPRRRALAPLIRTWRRLTSMRTALVLLFLLALAAVPGSLLPQRPLNPTKVDTYLAQHPSIGPLFDRLSLFNVFAAPWFAAIYLLLFISLIGCLVPRIRLHTRALRAAPPRAPRHLGRLPESTSYAADGAPSAIADEARRELRGARWRVVTREEPGGVVTVSAEKGYLRETGNLLFHVALTALLVAVAIGKLWGYSGSVLVQEGDGFCNTVQQYDSFRPGREVSGSALAPFCMTLNKFSATYEPDGTAEQFRADIHYSKRLSSRTQRDVLRVNHPLRMEGLRLYLLGHGYSPVFTVRDASGQVFSRVPAPFLPQNSNFASQGALKLPDAKPKQLALDGFFAPTAATAGGVLTSTSPVPKSPAVAIFVYEGDLGVDSGQPQSVYSIDRQQLQNGALKRVGQKNLTVGQTYRLRDGTSIRFDGYKQWASLQVSRDPSQDVVLGAAIAIVLGLLLSLRIRRRRMWLRLTPIDEPDGGRRTVVDAGGLARTDAGVFSQEFRRTTGRLRDSSVQARGKD